MFEMPSRPLSEEEPSSCQCLPAAAGRPRLFSDGPNMFNSLTTVVGYLNAEGYCYNGKCHVRTQCPNA